MQDQKYHVMCRVSGGVTGTRQTLLKKIGVIAVFDSEKDARDEAARLCRQFNHIHAVAFFEYWPVEASNV